MLEEEHKTCLEEGIHCFCEEPCNCFPPVPQEKVVYSPEFSKCMYCEKQGIEQWSDVCPKRTAYDIWYCSLHYAQQCQQLIPAWRRMEDRLDALAKTLKCHPDEVALTVRKKNKEIKAVGLELAKLKFKAAGRTWPLCGPTRS